jgi:hypothetical protein
MEEDLKARLHPAPQPPEGFDPLSATPDELEQFGLPPRPDPRRYEAAFGVWQRMMSPPLEIVPATFPVLTAKFDYRISVEALALKVAVSDQLESSANWSGGYITANHTGPFLMVFGSWTIPTPDQPAEPQMETIAVPRGLDWTACAGTRTPSPSSARPSAWSSRAA